MGEYGDMGGAKSLDRGHHEGGCSVLTEHCIRGFEALQLEPPLYPALWNRGFVSLFGNVRALAM